MALVERLKGILLEPKGEWPKIAAEAETVQSIYTSWIMILAAIGPLAMVVVSGMLGIGVQLAIAIYLQSLISVAVLALIIDALTASFGGSKDFPAALKLVAYAFTPIWVAQIGMIFPFLWMLFFAAGVIYACYLFLLGAPVLKKCTAEKAAPYTIIVLLCAIVLWYIVRLAFGGVSHGATLAQFTGG